MEEQALSSQEEQDPIVNTFICPIGKEIIQTAVMTPYGRFYEKNNIEEWLRSQKTDPVTRAPLFPNQLMPTDITLLKKNILEPRLHELRQRQGQHASLCTPNEFLTAVSKGDLTTLIKHLPINTAKDAQGNSALHLAVLGGYLKMVKFLLLVNANVNAQNNAGETSLHLVAHASPSSQTQRDILKLLFKYNALLEIGNSEGNTPLHVAIQTKHEGRATELIKKNANVNAKNHQQETPLHLLIKHKGSKQFLKLLLEKKATVQVEDALGNTPLHYAIVNNNLEAVKILLEKSANINAKNKQGCPPLHAAACSGNVALTTLLLNSQGISVDATNNKGETALHQAAAAGNSEIVALLLSAKANINTKDFDGNTPLHLALMQQRTPPNFESLPKDFIQKKVVVIERLIKEGANIAIRNSRQELPFHLAIHYAYPENIVQALATKKTENEEVSFYEAKDNAGTTPLHTACLNGDEKNVEMLLKKSTKNAKTKNNQGYTPLHYAVKKGQTNIVKMLIKDCSDEIALTVPNNEGDTPFHLAIRGGHTEIAKLLWGQELNKSKSTDNKNFLSSFWEKKAGEALLVTDKKNNRFLHQAIESDNPEMLKFILEQVLPPKVLKMHLEYTNNMQDTPLLLAVRLNNPNSLSMIKILMAYTPNINTQDSEGNTPLHVAIQNDNVPLVHLLLVQKPNLHITNQAKQTPYNMVVALNRQNLLQIVPKPKEGFFTTVANTVTFGIFQEKPTLPAPSPSPAASSTLENISTTSAATSPLAHQPRIRAHGWGTSGTSN